MRRKIRGAIYDTDTAQEIARWEGDLEGVDDVLYRTKSGKYFVAKAQYVDEDYMERGEYQIIIAPESREDAIRLACGALGVDAAKAYFQDEGDGEVRQLNVRVSARTYGIIRDEAAKRGVSMATIIEELVNEGSSFGDDSAIFNEMVEEERQRKEARRRALEAAGKAG